MAAWVHLTAGMPPEPSYDDLLAGRDQLSPPAFLGRLFRELAGVDRLRTVRRARSEEGGWLERAWGYCGTRERGYLWDSQRDLTDSAIPMAETYLTYGLADATLLWSVSYRKRGQLGYASWQTGGLAARMTDTGAEAVAWLWAATWGTRPVFAPSGPDEVAQCEERVREGLARLRPAPG